MTTSNHLHLLRTLLIVGSAWLAAHLCFWLVPGVFATWNAQTLDQLFVLREAVAPWRPYHDDTIVQVELTTSTPQKLQKPYPTHADHARVVRNLAAMQVAAQVHDFIVEEPSDPDTAAIQALVDATAAAGQVYFGLALEPEKGTRTARRWSTSQDVVQYLQATAWPVVVHGDPISLYRGLNPRATFPALARASQGLGYLNVESDRDGVFRRHPLLVRYGGAFYPSLALRVICDYLQVPPSQILVTPGQRIVLRQAQRPGTTTPRDIVIPMDHHGNMLVNYFGPWERITRRDFGDIWLASGDRDLQEILREELAGKVVIVADVWLRPVDFGAMPLDMNYPLPGLHINAMHTILTEQFLRELTPWEMLGVEMLVLLALLLVARWAMSHWFALGALAVAVSYIVLVATAFLYGHMLANLVRPLLMIIFATLGLVTYYYIDEEKAKLEGLRQRDFIYNTFGRYLSSAVVDELLGSPDGLDMGGELREITLLVSDLRGFTSLAGQLSPHEVVAILNRYFERMIDIIAQYRGTVDELQGDGILAFFGAPLAAPDDPERAIACAIRMQRALADLNAEQRQRQLPELAMGIGINTGEVIVGNIGSEKRTKYGAVGSEINTTYRIESHTTGGQILLGPGTYRRVQALVHLRGTLQAQFKGLHAPVTLYDVGGLGGHYQLTLPDTPVETFVTLAAPLLITYFPIAGKLVADTGLPGALTRLTSTAAEATLKGQVEIYTNLKIHLVPPDSAPLSEVYAKVLTLEPLDSGASHVHLEFTSLPDDAKAFLAQQRVQPQASQNA